jgi:hypothetical protein
MIKRKPRKNTLSFLRNADGTISFSATQSYLRFNLCKEALGKGKYLVKLKHIYRDTVSQRDYAQTQINYDMFDRIYRYLDGLGWGSQFENYDETECLEGSFYPFIRYYGKRIQKICDLGCIWIGTREKYPRVHVQNGYCRWYKPINKAGIINTMPFMTIDKIQDHYYELTSPSFISSLEND